MRPYPVPFRFLPRFLMPLALLLAPAFAQVAPASAPAAGAAVVLEAFTVTGSNIRRVDQENSLPVTIGTHELILRHPELGDHRQALDVTLASVARVSVDLRKP